MRGLIFEIFKVSEIRTENTLKNIGFRIGPIKKPVGGEEGIRTLGTVSSTQSFQDCPFNRSGTSPYYLIDRPMTTLKLILK